MAEFLGIRYDRATAFMRDFNYRNIHRIAVGGGEEYDDDLAASVLSSIQPTAAENQQREHLSSSQLLSDCLESHY